MKRQVRMISATAFALTAAMGSANAQVLSGGLAPIQNSAAAGARSPGRMVTSSIARLEQVMVEPIRTFSGINEIETPGVGEVFRSEAATVLVLQLTIAIDLFVEAFLTRSGITESPDASQPDNGGRDPGGRDDDGGRTPGGRKVQAPPR